MNSPAGDLTSTIDSTLQNMEAQQAQTFAPDYLQEQEALHNSLIETKQAIEDTITTQDPANDPSGDEEASEEDTFNLKGPQGSTVEGAVNTIQNGAQGQDGPILSVTTAQGDVIYYRGNRIDSIERWDGAVLRNITVDDNNNLIAADITYPD